jgi:hypothetical protein
MENDLTLADEMIDAWHDGAGQSLELHEYLGLTFDEYAKVFRDPKTLNDAVRRASMEALRETHTDYTDRSDEHRMYCRADGQPWPCADGRKAWYELYPDEFPLISE